MTLNLNELTDITRFATDVKNGWINFSQKDNDNHYIIACYSTATQFAGHWVQDTTLLARGLVMKLTDDGMNMYNKIHLNQYDASIDDISEMLTGATIQARGMRKFFTVDAANSEWGKIKLIDDDENVTVNDDYTIDYNAPASVSDKLDGALGIGVIMNDDYIIATKGSFRSDEAVAGTGFMHDKHDSKAFASMMMNELPDYTPLFEIITPGDFHVVQYGNLADICFLGLLNQKTGWWIPAALLDTDSKTVNTNAGDIAGKFGFITPTVYKAQTLGDALAMPELANHEGMVATLDSIDDNKPMQDMFKIKYPMFLMLQRLKNSTSGKALRDYVNSMSASAIMDGDNPDIAQALPVDARDAAAPILARLNRQAQNDYIMPIRNAVSKTISIYDNIISKHDLTTPAGVRDYALEINSMGLTGTEKAIMFAYKNVHTGNTTGVITYDDLINAGVIAAKRTILK